MGHSSDLLIVGAGYAGLACARAAAARGLNTLVWDRKPVVGHHPHTTGILVKEAADLLDVPRALTRKVRGVRLYGPALQSIDLTSPGYYFLAADTPGLLRWMAGEAQQAGATVECGRVFQGADRTRTGWRLPYAETEARFLVGADGARSKVAQWSGLGRNQQFLLGVEGEWEGVEGVEEDRLHVFLDGVLAPGYIGWAVPGVGVTQIGLATRERETPALQALVTKLQGVFDFRNAREISRRGGLIPCGGTVRPFYQPGVLLLGDAAGTVSPLTAGGIHPALELGRRAGLAVSDHLLEGAAHPGQVLTPALPAYAVKKLLRRIFHSVSPPHWLLNVFFDSMAFRKLAQTVFFHHRGLLTPEAWRDLMRTTENVKVGARR